MAPQFCPECGTVVPVTDGTCHLGHPVPADRRPADDPATAAPDPEEPAPWVATVEDDDIEPGRDPDPSGPPLSPTALGSVSAPPAGAPNVAPSDLDHVRTDPADEAGGVTGFTAASVETTADDGSARVPAEHAPEEAPVTDHTPPEPEPADDDTSLEDLAAMAAAGNQGEGDDDLSHLGDDLSGDLRGGPGSTPPSPDAYDLDGASTDDEFDLGSLEEAVADLEGEAPAPPPGDDLAPQAPGPDAAPAPEQAIAEFPRTSDDDVADAPTADEQPVAIRPDRDQAQGGAPPDPKNFTASGKKVSPATGGSGGGSLLDRIKAIFGR